MDDEKFNRRIEESLKLLKSIISKIDFQCLFYSLGSVDLSLLVKLINQFGREKID